MLRYGGLGFDPHRQHVMEKNFKSIIMTKQEKRRIPDEEKGCDTFILFILFLSCFVSNYDGYKNPK
jgi:hypothetical protein